MNQYIYHVSLFSYLLTLFNICLIFFKIYIDNTPIFIAYLALLLFILFMVIRHHLEQSMSVPYKTWKEKSQMNIDEYFEHTLPKNSTNKPDTLKLIAMGSGLFSFIVFTWRMVSSPNGIPMIKNSQYFSQNHEILTIISKEEYSELLRLHYLNLSTFPLILSTIGIWKFYQYKK